MEHLPIWEVFLFLSILFAENYTPNEHFKDFQHYCFTNSRFKFSKLCAKSAAGAIKIGAQKDKLPAGVKAA